ncbi:MAG TPA: hypothetical protein VEM58_09505 [Streptosporangiaceae bacterium]|nr:hypothetical protein [Streptosporangiaceae bacterium]
MAASDLPAQPGAFYVTALADIPRRSQWLDESAGARPGSRLPLLFRGPHSTRLRRGARGDQPRRR